jgi:hypothetical protein
MGNVHGAIALATEPTCGSNEKAFRVPLSKGLFALVDVADFERLSKWKWYAQRGRRGRHYAVRTDYSGPKQSQVMMHRVVLDAPTGSEVDHRNGDALDNRRCNLRICTRTQNARNITSSKRQKLGGYKGVAWDPRKNKWRAVISVPGVDGGRGKQRQIGRFDTPELAARAYDAAAKRLYGEFAAPNFKD